MTKGQRLADICGECLLLTACMNNFRHSDEEEVQVAKIADARTAAGSRSSAACRRVRWQYKT